ncbi:MAG TPA: aspartate-semialdehyde dehydrogenase [Gemmatimonadaceae bacterium]|nr:aspartate-semialdehyde dehydrogenase [Gemmatimonadaceae bacterium]
MIKAKQKVAVLGATGAVGQTFIRLLAGHPWFEVAEVVASERSAGQRYRDVVRWQDGVLPPEVGELTILPTDSAQVRSQIAFSAMDSSVAGPIEEQFASAGKTVLTNSKNHRMDPDVPLVIPEINADHMALLEGQRSGRGWKGAIIANANCSATVAAMALAPLQERFGINTLFLSTMQAISGAGYPGLPSADILGNVIPFIADEEEKIEIELRKILGKLNGGSVADASFGVSAHTNRVPVEHGHTVCMSIGLEGSPDPATVRAALDEWTGSPAVRHLPGAKHRPLVVRDEPDRPQPRRDVNAGDGMTVQVGRVRADAILDVRLVAMGHNTVRGAAGGSILNAELLLSTGAIPSA